MELSDFCVYYSTFCVFRLDLHSKYRMAPWAGLVVTGWTHVSASWPFYKNLQSLWTPENRLLRDSFDINPFFNILSDLKVTIVFGIK